MENFPQEERKGFVRDTMRKLSIHMPRSEASFQSKLAQYEIEIEDLQERIRVVEHDSESLVRHLEKTISHYEALKRKYHQSLEQLTQGKKQNEKLVGALQEAKEQFGIDEPLAKVVEYFKAAALGSDGERRILLLYGPPSSGKDHVVILSKRGLEEKLERQATMSHRHTDVYGSLTNPDHRRTLLSKRQVLRI